MFITVILGGFFRVVWKYCSLLDLCQDWSVLKYTSYPVILKKGMLVWKLCVWSWWASRNLVNPLSFCIWLNIESQNLNYHCNCSVRLCTGHVVYFAWVLYSLCLKEFKVRPVSVVSEQNWIAQISKQLHPHIIVTWQVKNQARKELGQIMFIIAQFLYVGPKWAQILWI